jgi:hypothetical protein
MGWMWADLPVEKNIAAIAFPRLSASGKPIGALKETAALPCTLDETAQQARCFRFGRSGDGWLPRYGRYLESDRGVYLRPPAMRIDTYC